MAARIDANLSIKGDPFDRVLSFHDNPDGFVMFIDSVAVVFDSFSAAEAFFIRTATRLKAWDEEVRWRAPTSDG